MCARSASRDALPAPSPPSPPHLAADCKALVRKARELAAEFEFDHGYPVPVHYLAKLIADENQIYTQHAYKRSYAAIMMLGA